MMILGQTLQTIWSMLERTGRYQAVGLLGLLILAGFAEMAGMMVLFGYIAVVTTDGAAGGRAALLKGALSWLVGPLEAHELALLGGGIVIAVTLGKNGLIAGVDAAVGRFLMTRAEHVAVQLLRGYLRAPYAVFKQRGIAEPRQQVQKVLELFKNSFTAAGRILASAAMVFMVGLLLLWVDPVLTVAAAAFFTAGGLSVYQGLRQRVGALGSEAADSRQEASRVLRTGFGGLIDMRLTGTEAHFMRGYAEALRRARRAEQKLRFFGQLPRAINETLLAVGIVLAVVYFTVLKDGVSDALPTLALFGFAGLRMTGTLTRISTALQTLRRNQTAFEDFLRTARNFAPHVLGESKPSGAKPPGDGERGQPVDAATGGVAPMAQGLRLQGVSFTYPDASHAAVSDITLTVNRGSFVGICGPSGGGKTTLLLLMMGLLRPQRGAILCDGRSVFDDPSAWHGQIGYVGQRPFIMPGSVRDNVAFGCERRDVDDARVWRALTTARVGDFVHSLPHGLDTDLGEEGHLFSGGERQRISIARALYHEPSILFFDEATAALDTLTEQAVTESIAALSGHRTIVAVAHRLSTLRDCDSIHLVDDGRIVASGSYTQLLKESAAFRALAGADDAASPLSGAPATRYGAL